MGSYIPFTTEEQREMLSCLAAENVQALFADIPAAMRSGTLQIPAGKTEFEVRRQVEDYANQNKIFPSIFRGAGAYKHYIPAIVKQVSAKETFVTAYTPYQAEISQGILQMIFEYQSDICALTGMELSNASVYDGASAAAEAIAMCCERKRTRALVAANAHPDTLAVIKTYSESAGRSIEIIPLKDGLLDLDALRRMLTEDVACVYLQSPNYYGMFENAKAVAEMCHAGGAKLIYGCNPIALGLFETPAEAGADIAVGEGQPLGLALSFGGPYLGFMACSKALMRRMPGRIVGETRDADGKRCFVLTLQAREQHIRREKALSSICSNQALCALTAGVYLAAMGPHGLRGAARQCYAKAHYAAEQLAGVGYPRRHSGAFFHEFVTKCPADSARLLATLEREGILGGLPVADGILWCCTEMNTKQEIDHLVKICKREAAS